MQENLPFRGVITKNNFIADLQNNLFISEAFKELSVLECSIEFSGCCILNDAADEILAGINGGPLESNQDLRRFPLVLFPVPLKEEKTSQMWCLNWPHMFLRNKLQKSSNYLVEPKKTLRNL